jgi:hypothetical protein
MIKCCRPLKVEVFELQDKTFLSGKGWKPAEPAKYKGMHGVKAPEGEGRDELVSR